MTFSIDIVEAARHNEFFRHVLFTGPHAQVVVMSVPACGEIGEEVHEGVDQILSFVAGEGVAILDGEESPVGPDRLVQVPAGMRHNVVNRGSFPLRLYTIHAPPQHAHGMIHRTRTDADEADADEADHLVALK